METRKLTDQEADAIRSHVKRDARLKDAAHTLHCNFRFHMGQVEDWVSKAVPPIVYLDRFPDDLPPDVNKELQRYFDFALYWLLCLHNGETFTHDEIVDMAIMALAAGSNGNPDEDLNNAHVAVANAFAAYHRKHIFGGECFPQFMHRVARDFAAVDPA